MKLNSIYLDGFGHFHQHAIGGIDGPITVLYGPNEAGKSTLLAFIRAILFGFPTRYNSHYPPLAGGRHGGRIALSTDQGTAYVVERYAGSSGGLKVTGPTGPASDSETMIRQLIGPATSDVFRTVFAFSLEELHEVASFQDSSIYSAGQGAPTFPALKKALADKKGTIYLPRGRVQEVPKLLGVLQEVEQQLRAVHGNADRYGKLTYRRSAIGNELDAIHAGQSRVTTRIAEISRLLDGWDDWIGLTNCESRLQELPRIEKFPENAVARLEGLETRLGQARDDVDAEAEQLRLGTESASVDIPDERLVENAALVDEIRRARDRFDSSAKDLPDRQSDLRRLEAAVAGGLRELGQGWSEADLEAFDSTLVVRSQVDTWKERVAKSLQSRHEAKDRLSQNLHVLQEIQLELQEAHDNLPGDTPLLDFKAITERHPFLIKARRRWENYERELRDHSALVGQLSDITDSHKTSLADSQRAKALLAILVALGIVFVAAGALLGGSAFPMGIAAGVAVAIATAYLLWLSSNSSSTDSSPMASVLSRQIAHAKHNMDAAASLLTDSAEELGLTQRPDADSLDSQEASLESARIASETWKDAQTQVDDASRRLKSQEQRVETARQQHEEAQTSLRQVQQAWREWLANRGLDQSMTPDAVVTSLARVETTRTSLAEARRMQDRVQAIQRSIAGFCSQVTSLSNRNGEQVNRDDQQRMAVVADNLIARTDEARLQIARREEAKDSEESSKLKLKRQVQRLQSVKQEVSVLLASGETDDPEEFRRRARQNHEQLRLRQELNVYLRNLERLSGPGDSVAALREQLANSEPGELEAASLRLSDKQTVLEEQRDRLRQELGGIDAEVARLTNEEDSSALRVRRNTLLAELRERAEEWSRLTIAETLLEKTRQRFERERQPSVIRYAQEFFATVTDQRYPRLYAPIGEQTITVTDSAGGNKQPSELSRGTREQLYLALRFGLIREFGEHAEGLPVVIDEALVNFDSERARAAVQAFAELSATNQILVFTCHSSTADVFFEVAGAQLMQVS